MKKIKLKKKMKFTTTFLIITISVLICSFLLLQYISKKVSPSFFKYAEIETKKFSNIIINDAIASTITDKTTSGEIFEIVNDENGEIKTIDFNTANINKYLTEATKSIQEDLKNIEKGNIQKVKSKGSIKNYSEADLKKGIISYINSGIVFKNPILANLGPKVPVKISLAGDVISFISAEVDDYGINNSLIKVFVNLKITETIILPFKWKDIELEAKVPVAIKLVNGKIPNYYFGSSKETRTITVPNS